MNSFFAKSIAIFILFSGFAAATSETSSYEALIGLFRHNGVNPLFQERPFADSQNEKLVELGRLLFFDKILSGNRNISCATCHFPSKASSDDLPLPIGTGGEGIGQKRLLGKGHLIPRNAPTAFNLAYASFHTTMWDGRISIDPVNGILTTPEPKLNGSNPEAREITAHLRSAAAAQAMFPVTSNHEMRGLPGENDIADAKDNLEVWELLTDRLVGTDDGSQKGIPRYLDLFLKVYPEVTSRDEFNFGHVARALAAFEMSGFLASKSDFDLFLAGDSSALERSQIRGAQVFAGKGRCLSCHSGSHFTDFQFYSTGAPQLGPGKMPLAGEAFGEDLGLAHLTGYPRDNYKFKTPSLRNVALTGPWSHSGSCTDLKDFIKLHVGPDDMLSQYLRSPEKYLVSQSEVNYVALVDRDHWRNQARVFSRDPLLRDISLDDRELDDLMQFLRSLSDKSYQNRVRVPQAVPSGLKVDH